MSFNELGMPDMSACGTGDSDKEPTAVEEWVLYDRGVEKGFIRLVCSSPNGCISPVFPAGEEENPYGCVANARCAMESETPTVEVGTL